MIIGTATQKLLLFNAVVSSFFSMIDIFHSYLLSLIEGKIHYFTHKNEWRHFLLIDTLNLLSFQRVHTKYNLIERLCVYHV